MEHRRWQKFKFIKHMCELLVPFSLYPPGPESLGLRLRNLTNLGTPAQTFTLESGSMAIYVGLVVTGSHFRSDCRCGDSLIR